MIDHEKVYKQQTAGYDLLISKQPSLLPIITAITTLPGKHVLDIGAGTGRLTMELAPHVASIIAIDQSAEMLQHIHQKCTDATFTNVHTVPLDYRHLDSSNSLPCNHAGFDIIVAGWSICYTGSSNQPYWQQNVQALIQTCRQLLRPDGKIIIFETMGTNTTTPQPPSFLEAYYDYLEHTLEFTFQWHRLDYTFDDPEQCHELIDMFFDSDITESVMRSNSVVVPECVGVWVGSAT